MVEFRFYLVTNRSLCAPGSLAKIVSEACEAGVRCVQIREKDLDAASIGKLVLELSAATRSEGARLLFNADNAQLQHLDHVDGIHFPESKLLTGNLREQHGDMMLGASSHSQESAQSKADAGVDFITFGPVYDTPDKRRFGPPLGIEKLASVCANVSIPVIAIGGITPMNARDCIKAGAHGVAAMGAVMRSDNVQNTIRQFEEATGGL